MARRSIPRWSDVRASVSSGPWPVGVCRRQYSTTPMGLPVILGPTGFTRMMMGLSTLTHTPNPMGFLTEILERPVTERPYILFPVGYAAADCEVPDLHRKSLVETLIVREETSGLDTVRDMHHTDD